MKAILEFNLPEENEEYKMTNQAGDMMLLLHDLEQMFRQIRKYECFRGEQIKSQEIYDFAEKLIEDYYDLKNQRNVDV